MTNRRSLFPTTGGWPANGLIESVDAGPPPDELHVPDPGSLRLTGSG